MSASLEFVDTNILLYSIDHANADKQVAAQSLLDRLWHTRSGCLSMQVLQEFYVNATRKLSVPLGHDLAKQMVEDYSRWHVHSPTTQVLLASIELQLAHRITFWDALILGSANYLGADILWSEDLNHGQNFGPVEVRNPFLSA